MRYLIAALLVLTLSACTTSRGFDRNALRGQLADQKQVSGEIDRKVRSQLPTPFRLALYFTPPPAASRYAKDWSWLDDDRNALLAMGKELKRTGVVSDILAIDETFVAGNDGNAIREAAIRAGADAVLIVNGTCDIDRYNNDLSYSYLLLLPALVVAGSDADALCIAHATLWDLRSPYRYLTVEGEGSAKDIKPYIFIDEQRILKNAKSAALANLKAELTSRLTGSALK